ncbi:MAG: Smr/MutS family protein [Bacilli bacterium]|nr:Smr/MutS family protein [Bacilli bacterium]
MNDPFLYNLPYIDVHGLDREYTIMLLKNLILESILLKNYKIYIIHGKGSGILKKEIHNYLKTNKYVEKYYIYNFNDGITMIELKNN